MNRSIRIAPVILTIAVCFATLPSCGTAADAAAARPDNRGYGTIFNNDSNNILHASSGPGTSIEEYKRALNQILDAKPGIFAQDVGDPDAVSYRTEVATNAAKYGAEVVMKVWPKSEPAKASRDSAAMNKLLELGTDPLAITIEECRRRGVLAVASYRMNAEDFYKGQLDRSDFGRTHKHLAIPGANCLDWAHPEVYKHRVAIFREVAEKYDIDGIEFDFRRWTHMISDPLNNHPILTRLVAETRQMLDETSKRKKRKRMILGVRVGPSIADPPGTEYAGGNVKTDLSSRELGLDVKTWIEKEYVDYVSPSLFWPRWPGLPKTKEFAALAKGKRVGIYPTLFPMPKWLDDDQSPDKSIEPGDTEQLKRYKEEMTAAALAMYEDGADGISTFNWYFHLHLSQMPVQWQAYYGYGMGASAVQKHVLSIMGKPGALRDYRKQTWFWPSR